MFLLAVGAAETVSLTQLNGDGPFPALTAGHELGRPIAIAGGALIEVPKASAGNRNRECVPTLPLD